MVFRYVEYVIFELIGPFPKCFWHTYFEIKLSKKSAAEQLYSKNTSNFIHTNVGNPLKFYLLYRLSYFGEMVI